jgi:ABC-type multidrug transport system ATPase subunit
VRGLAERGSAICYSTHYLGEVEELSASVAILDHGRIIARDSLEGLLRNHGQANAEPNLESVFLALTGREFAGGVEEVGDAPA